MVKEGMASGVVIIGINYRAALINETEALSDLDQILFFFLNYNSSATFAMCIFFYYLINAFNYLLLLMDTIQWKFFFFSSIFFPLTIVV